VKNVVGVLGFDFSRTASSRPRRRSTRRRTRGRLHRRGRRHAPRRGAEHAQLLRHGGLPTGNPLDNKCGPAQNVECRGWDFDQPTELDRQKTKLIEALAGIDADVLG
jgi:hypothetical protein